ncbi:hypothetical protein [Phenylobacterium sp.]|jgi:hypothetical protein|uniref:hypothetical protein n=1 Tax=Phenylobacterium sp. TaxID=1871053 RepID=UPI002F3E8D92
MYLRLAALAGWTAAAVAGAAFAQPEPATWADAPSVADFAALYPPKAKAAGVGGVVELTCDVRDARPHDCAALFETPSGYGFAFAARRAVEQMRVADLSLNGKEVRVPVTFDPSVLKGPVTLTRPVWAALPTATDFQLTFPKTENGVNNVRVVLACTVARGGLLSDCAVAQEEPSGQGYGAGALALAPKFRVEPWSDDGQPTIGAKLRLPIRYQLTSAKPDAAKP